MQPYWARGNDKGPKMNWMSQMLDAAGAGWKTYTAAIATILVGVIGLVLNFIDPDSNAAMEPTEAIAMITLGLSMLGLGHKGARVEKKLDELEKKTQG